MISARFSSSFSWLSLFLLPHAACASPPGITEKKLSKPVCCAGFAGLWGGGGGGGGGGRSESEVTAELTSLGTPEDGGRCIDRSEPE